MLDWRKILLRHGVDFREEKHQLYMQCPWCGDADQGTHLGISLQNKGWGCWRNAAHRGKNEARLLSALLNISMGQATNLVQDAGGSGLIDDNDLASKLKGMLGEDRGTTMLQRHTLEFPDEIRPLKDKERLRMFKRYLIARDYTPQEVLELYERYQLHYALTHIYRYRVVFPIFTKQHGLTTWTARSIVKGVEPRYLSLTEDPERAGLGPCALMSIKDCLFNETNLNGGGALIVCEGPFDAMRLDFYGKRFEVNATCLFSKNVSLAQVDKLADLSDKYRRKVMLLDPDAVLDQLPLWNRLSPLGFKMASIPAPFKDPAEMAEQDTLEFIETSILRKR